MTRIAIHQSQYIPWPPYFKKIAMADLFVVMDNVQYQKNGVQNRNKIRNKAGDFWLTIPVTGCLSDSIGEKRIASSNWQDKHWKSIESSYSQSKNWRAYAERLEELYRRTYATLHEANDAFFRLMIQELGITTRIAYLSDIAVAGAKSDLVLKVCLALGADIYISGFGSKGYLDEAAFESEGVAVDFVESSPPKYEQAQGPFIAGLSMLDMLLNADQTYIRNYLFGN